MMTASEYTRRAVIAQLEADGVEVQPLEADGVEVQPLEADGVEVQPRDAGGLYDLVGGRARYARIEDGQIVDMGYHDAKPDDGRTWLPVVHVDSEPFNIVRHWRLNPEARLDGDRVVVTYPVVSKSQEPT
jgi:hypothetical protein